MRTAFNIAALAMAFADGRAAIGTWSEFLAHEYLATHNAHSRQKFLNRVGDNAVYRTLCWILRWPRYTCRAPVSWPLFASA